MENPFTKYQKYIERPGRSSNDLSFDVNGTYRLGTLYPVGLWDVNAGESFKIRSAFGLKFIPMPYPIQTRLRANLYYYYVRNRNIYDGWKDFIYNNKSASEVPHPYIARPVTDKNFWRTGGIMDHLGCPTTIVKKNSAGAVTVNVWGLMPKGRTVTGMISGTSFYNSDSIYVNNATPNSTYRRFTQYSRPVYLRTTISDSWISDIMHLSEYRFHRVSQATVNLIDVSVAGDRVALGYCCGLFHHAPWSVDYETSRSVDLTFYNCVLASQVGPGDNRLVQVMVFVGDEDDDITHFNCVASEPDIPIVGSESSYTVTLNERVCQACIDAVAQGKSYFLFIGETLEQTDKFDAPLFGSPVDFLNNNTPNLGDAAGMDVFATDVVDLGDYPAMNPFGVSSEGDAPKLPLSSLPLRVYESIYNAWFRNERLEPLLVNGVPEYNKFCPNTANGADEYQYHLYQRNWESDYLTTALPTPQQGIAPVVGVTGLSDIQIDDDGHIVTFRAQVGEDGESIVGGSFNDPAASVNARRTAQDLVTAGFTINDLRNVNALQRWLENNLRRGLKYRDQVLANTGVKVRYDELDMPEFLGGFSRPVSVSSVTQTAPGGEAGVGDYAGQAMLFGENKHSITRYCDEAGFIMAVLCIVPEPVYSQNLPKYFLRQNPLDYFHPAFNHIGMQPVMYSEVCPLQVYQKNPAQTAEGGIRFNDVFGYQRPWYDLLARTNEVHGLMRTSMRDYVMNRTFDDVPELGAEFVHIDPEQVNDVFSVRLSDNDVCMGQIIHQCYVKRQISLFGQPKIQ